MAHAIGIDFGTTNCVAAVVRDGVPQVIPVDGSPLMPSIVSFTEDGAVLVGQAAKARRWLAPESTIASFKRFLADPAKRWTIFGRTYTPVDVAALLLRRLREAAEAFLGEPVAEAVITVPTWFTSVELGHLGQAGARAGLATTHRLLEPLAAAIRCGLEERSEMALVYHLGGATFEAELVRAKGGALLVVAAGGHQDLGGNDFLDVLAEHLYDRWQQHTGSQFGPFHDLFSPDPGVPEESRLAAHRLMEAAESAKIALSSARAASVRIADFLGTSLEEEVTREEYELFLDPIVDLTVRTSRNTLETAGLSPGPHLHVLLTGGSTQTPLVRERIRQQLGLPVGAEPADLVAAMGAARFAAVLAAAGPPRCIAAPTGTAMRERPVEKPGGANLAAPTVPEPSNEVPALDLAFPEAGTEKEEGLVAGRDEPVREPTPRDTAMAMPEVPQPATHGDEDFAQAGFEGEGNRPLHLDENVQFTVYRPAVVRPMEWRTLLAFAHLSELPPDAPPEQPHPIEEMKRQVEQALGEKARDYTDVRQDSSQGVPREGEITFKPEIPGIEFNPPSRSFLWLESVHCEEFRLRARPELDGEMARGRLTVFLGSIILADIPLAIRVDSHAEATPARPSREPVVRRPYQKVFASYSHKDLEIVEELEQRATSTGLGVSYLRDLLNLRAGKVWRKELARMIEEADIFQLFWSWNSMRSDNVRDEWKYALSLRRPDFVRPVYWEEPRPEDRGKGLPPDALDRLHFERIRLGACASSRVGPRGSDSARAAGPGAAAEPGSFARRVIRFTAPEELLGPPDFRRPAMAPRGPAALAEALREAHMAFDEARCRELLAALAERRVAAVDESGDKLCAQLAEQVAAATKWLREIDEERNREAAFREACAALKRALDNDEGHQTIERLAAAVLRHDLGMPHPLAARYDAHVAALQPARRMRVGLTFVAVFAAVVLLIILWLLGWFRP
ncbi:MAG TPA: Hsp70 family protein [Planctomycetota bacterium]|nr:Hsp70 family protein [Planctomycetota bacterium]